jgi:SAM-dependent methyltransferase
MDTGVRRILNFFSSWMLFLKMTLIQTRQSRVRQFFAGGNRRLYQDKLVNFSIKPTAKVLDIGSGPVPFAEATVLCERYLGDTVHRRGAVVRKSLPLIVADIHALPFKSKSFDFIYCAHVLEHVEDPISACTEIMRVGRKGYLETPNFMKDMLFCQAEPMNHRWHSVALGNTLFFFEYTSRQREGIQSLAWHDLIWARFYHPLQDVFVNNQDLFNTMFLWFDKFNVQVVRSDGTTKRK